MHRSSDTAAMGLVKQTPQHLLNMAENIVTDIVNLLVGALPS
jgi:hypothetical protein